MFRDKVVKLTGLNLDSPALDQALTHPSFANEDGAEDNQRLEFLGDAVLGFCVAELLYQRFPQATEGELTRMRARLVNADTLSEWARANELSAALRLGRGASNSGLQSSTNVLADAVEAVIAAAYQNVDLDAARRLCADVVSGELDRMASAPIDPKSELQERMQARRLSAPTYRVVESGGPDHERWFEVAVSVEGSELARGRGKSKRQAERAAAEQALAGDQVNPSSGSAEE